jgi:hypothetical protein
MQQETTLTWVVDAAIAESFQHDVRAILQSVLNGHTSLDAAVQGIYALRLIVADSRLPAPTCPSPGGEDLQ